MISSDDREAPEEVSGSKKQAKSRLKNPAIAAEWERRRPQREYIQAIIAARLEQNLTQKELAKRTGIQQSNISRIENGNCSPTVATLQQIADGVGKKLHIEFR